MQFHNRMFRLVNNECIFNDYDDVSIIRCVIFVVRRDIRRDVFLMNMKNNKHLFVFNYYLFIIFSGSQVTDSMNTSFKKQFVNWRIFLSNNNKIRADVVRQEA
jgi:hypothetical protein